MKVAWKNECTSLSSGTSAIIVPYYITCALTTLSPLCQRWSTNTFFEPSKRYPDRTGPHWQVKQLTSQCNLILSQEINAVGMVEIWCKCTKFEFKKDGSICSSGKLHKNMYLKNKIPTSLYCIKRNIQHKQEDCWLRRP